MKAGTDLYKKFAFSHLAGDFGDNEEFDLDKEECEKERQLDQESKAFNLFTSVASAMNIFHEDSDWNIDGALIDTGSNCSLSVSLPPLPAVLVVNMKDTQPKMRSKPKS